MSRKHKKTKSKNNNLNKNNQNKTKVKNEQEKKQNAKQIENQEEKKNIKEIDEKSNIKPAQNKDTEKSKMSNNIKKDKENDNSENKSSNKVKQFYLKYRKVILIIALITFFITVAYLSYYYFSKGKEVEDINKIQEYTPEIKETENIEKTELMLKVEELKNINEDTRGWIEIKDSPINYPLLQGTDNEYYLKHDYKKESNKHGSIYLKAGCDINDVNSNLIIYGHNLNDNEMFNNVLKYTDKTYYETHKIINITTENEEREYEVIAAFKSRVFYEKEENVFRYYNYLNFKDKVEYDDYLSNVRKLQLYDTGIEANYGEQLVTLITCEYSVENGRMVVVAKRIK